MPNDGNSQALMIKGRTINEDEHGYVCLDDIWELAKAPGKKSPKRWRQTPPAKRLMAAL